MTMEIKKISYSEWLKYVRVTIEKGRHCDEFKALQCSSPVLMNTEHENYAIDELSKLESKLIKDAIGDFQKSINKSFEEMDIYIFEKGVKLFKKSISDCVFFNTLDSFSDKTKNGLKESIRMNYQLFIDEFSKYLRIMYEYGNYSFVDEMNYIYKKAGIQKFIQEQTLYE